MSATELLAQLRKGHDADDNRRLHEQLTKEG